jgi:hypothetical protein
VCLLCSVDKDQSHVIGGLKATISNPNTSPEAKEHAAQRLEELTERTDEPPHHELGTHQIAGYKATISSSWDSLGRCPIATHGLITRLQTPTLRIKRRNTLVRFW